MCPMATAPRSTAAFDELIASREKQPGTWVELKPGARYIFVRNYFLREHSAQNDPDVHIYLEIEPIDDPGPAPALDDATFGTRLRDAAALLHATTLGLR